MAGHANFSAEEKKRFLSELTAAEGLERYLGAKFPGAKRFSLEGGDALVPMLKELIRHAGKSGTREVVLGMAHRGRLNVLVNVLGKKPQDLFDEFAGKHKEHLGTGDVKYHMGFSSDIETEGGQVHLALAFNPSHWKSSARWLSVPCVRVWIVWTSRAAIKYCQSLFTVMRRSQGRAWFRKP